MIPKLKMHLKFLLALIICVIVPFILLFIPVHGFSPSNQLFKFVSFFFVYSFPYLLSSFGFVDPICLSNLYLPLGVYLLVGTWESSLVRLLHRFSFLRVPAVLAFFCMSFLPHMNTQSFFAIYSVFFLSSLSPSHSACLKLLLRVLPSLSHMKEQSSLISNKYGILAYML